MNHHVYVAIVADNGRHWSRESFDAPAGQLADTVEFLVDLVALNTMLGTASIQLVTVLVDGRPMPELGYEL